MKILSVENVTNRATLSDKLFSITYPELAEQVHLVKEQLTRLDVQTGDAIALSCTQSIASITTLIALLEREQSIFLSDGRYQAPAFCKVLVTAEPQGSGGRLSKTVIQCKGNQDYAKEATLGAPALCLRTSGSTKSARMVVHHPSRLLENSRSVFLRFALSRDDRIMLPVPLYHLYGLGAAALPALLAGASVYLHDSTDLLGLLQADQSFDANVIFLTPGLAASLVSTRRERPSFRVGVTAGDRLTFNVFEKCATQMNCLVQIYGSTEQGAMSSTSLCDSADVRANTVGLPFSGVQLRIDGQTGEIECRNRYASLGYTDGFGHITAHPEYQKTGDIGQHDANGCLRILGRSNDLVKRDGVWVSLSEIEGFIAELPGVSEVAVVPGAWGRRGVQITAYCVSSLPLGLSPDGLRQSCLQHLPRRSVPDVVNLVSALPRLSTGKIDRRQLAARLEAGHL